MKSFSRIILLLFVISSAFAQHSPDIFFMTWTKDPLHSATCVWLQEYGYQEIRALELYSDGSWERIPGLSRRLADGVTTRYIANIDGLEPGQNYEIRFEGCEEIFFFQTAPETAHAPVRFAVGGDALHHGAAGTARTHEMNQVVAAYDPLFVVVGGDLAYSVDKGGRFGDQASRWYAWLRQWTRDMRAPDGRIIALLPAIGNHDVMGRYTDEPGNAPYYFDLFPMPGLPGYAEILFGDYLQLLLLDSGHVNRVDGPQLEWIESTLAAHPEIPHRMAAYHVPAYPSQIKDSRAARAQELRELWVPLFDRYALDVAFEHHEHTYKRSFKLKGQRVDPSGTLYLGDGAWGVPPRKVATPDELWYLERSDSRNHAFIVQLQETTRFFIAVDNQGSAFDVF